jgi:hypothetical protein
MSKPSLYVEYKTGSPLTEKGIAMNTIQTATVPHVSIRNGEKSKKYIIIMYDRFTIKGKPLQYIHWIFSRENDSQKEILPYIKPTPPPGSGQHTYTFALYPANENTPLFSNRSISLEEVLGLLGIQERNPIDSVSFFIKTSPSGGRREKTRKRRSKRRKTVRHFSRTLGFK